MNKKRFIVQYNFNDRPRPNGYHKFTNGDYYTCMNWQFLGLFNRDDLLIYYIR